MSRLFASSLIALAFVTSPVAPLIAPTAAAQERQTVSVTVPYDDLDIDTPAGARTLLDRISVASKKVCGKPPSTLMLSVPDKRTECRANAVRQTVLSLNEPAITLAWQAQTGTTIQTAAR
jgi:UrcA family protein